MTDDDRKNLGKALSGFANSDGGIVIWGIGECKDNSEDPPVDKAKELKPIDKLSGFLSDLQNYTPQLTSPPVIGVIHEPIRESEGADTGYIISYIPASEVNGQ